MQVFRDKEIKWFYLIVAGLPSVVLVLVATDGSKEAWLAAGLLALGVFIVLLVGWPLSAIVTTSGDVTFRRVFWQTKLTAENLVTVKCTGAHDYRAHIVLRTRYGLPIGYRCRQYTDGSILARAVLELIEKAPNAQVTDDALKLLRQTAKGNKKPLLAQ